MAIDIGTAATDRAGGASPAGRTIIAVENPANATGYLDVFQVFVEPTTDMTALKVGTFSGSGTDYDDRDFETIGAVANGSTQTFTGKNCDVVIGDFVGFYEPTGLMSKDNSGSGIYVVTGDKFAAGVTTYSLTASRTLSLYATGIEPSSVVGSRIMGSNIFPTVELFKGANL